MAADVQLLRVRHLLALPARLRHRSRACEGSTLDGWRIAHGRMSVLDCGACAAGAFGAQAEMNSRLDGLESTLSALADTLATLTPTH